MVTDPLGLGSSLKKHANEVVCTDPLVEIKVHLDGHNKDIVDLYYWHLHFSYLEAKSYFPIKLEDHHYFSENSQFGANMRQVKGGSIRAFQENLAQMIQLVKVHMLPLLKEVQKTEFMYKWIREITENDEKYQKFRKQGKTSVDPEVRAVLEARNEAINAIKDRWVSEVEGGRLWQMQRSQSEQGLDFALLPQLFFGINLDNPLVEMHGEGPSLNDQLQSDIYTVDITLLAKEQVSRFLFRFHKWLPTAIKETQTNYRIKISALKQFYSQLQMYVEFMKPLLIEIARKTETLSYDNPYKGFEMNDPDIVSLFDYSYSFVKFLTIRDFQRTFGMEMKDLEFTRHGFYLNEKCIRFGPQKGKKGFIVGMRDPKADAEEREYAFMKYEGDPEELSTEEFAKLKAKWDESPLYIHEFALVNFTILMFDFSQRRRMEIMQTQQGAQQVPYMRNEIIYRGYNWNVYEVAAYREKLKIDNLELIETFIEEIREIKEDLLYYMHDVKRENESHTSVASEKRKEEKKKEKTDFSLVTGPIQGLGELFSPLLPSFSFSSSYKKKTASAKLTDEMEDHKLLMQLNMARDLWKVYRGFKISYGLFRN